MEHGAAPDGLQLVPAITRVTRRAGCVPRAVTADRGYGQPAVERDLHELGVRTVAIPRQAPTSPARKIIEHSRGFRRLIKWRTGAKDGSATSNAATAGTGPSWTARTEPRSGAGTGTHPQPGQDQRPGRITRPDHLSLRLHPTRTHPYDFFRSK